MPTPANRAVWDVLALHAGGRSTSVNLPRLTFRVSRFARSASRVMRSAEVRRSAQARRRCATAPLLLVDLDTHEGVTGHAYQFCYRAAAAPAVARFLDDIIEAVKGQPSRRPICGRRLSKRYMLIGVEGIVRMAMSLVDVAGWDALAHAAGQPLARLLGVGTSSDSCVQQ